MRRLGEEADVEGNAFTLIADHGNGAGRAFHFANAASKAAFPIVDDGAVGFGDGEEGTSVDAIIAKGAKVHINLRDVARAGHHGHPALGHLSNPSAAALTAITDGVEAIDHRVFEPRGVDVATKMFVLEQLQGFFASQAA